MQKLRIFKLLPLAFLLWAADALAKPPGVTVETLLDTDETILGQEFEYPAGRARITAAIITVHPHGSIDLHEHPVPLVAYILQGELAVVYEGIGEIRYNKGESFVEAFEIPHHAYNAGRGKVQILAVYAGSNDVPNAVLLD